MPPVPAALPPLLYAYFWLPLLGIDLPLPSNPLMARDLGVSVDSAQLGLALFALGYGVMHPIFGPLADRFGRRPFVYCGLGLLVGGSVICALASGIEMLLAGRAMQGLGAAAGPLLARAIIRDIYTIPQAARRMGSIMALFGVGAALMPLVGGQIAEWVGWRGAYWFAAAFCGGVLVWTLAVLPETRPDTAPQAVGVRRLLVNYWTLATDSRFILVTMCGTLVAAGMFIWIGMSPFVIQTVLGYSPGEFSLIYAGVIVAFVSSSWLSGRLAGRYGSLRVVLAGVAVATVGAVACLSVGFGVTVTLAILLPTVLLIVFGHGLAYGQSMAASVAPFPHLAATASALYGFIQYGINGLVTAASGALFDGTATPMLAMMGVCALLAALVYLVYAARVPRAARKT